MKILDLFCKAGGAAMGISKAFPDAQIIGVDIERQPHYPFEFVQCDWRDGLREIKKTSFIWASPPCQRYSTMTKKWGRSENHPDLVGPVREELKAQGIPYCIENVPSAPLLNPTILCGSMFGLKLRRHRHFETSFQVGMTPPCDHSYPVVGVYGHAGGSSKRDGLKFSGTDSWREAMGINWMTGNELAEAIPPAYSEFIFKQFLAMEAR